MSIATVKAFVRLYDGVKCISYTTAVGQMYVNYDFVTGDLGRVYGVETAVSNNKHLYSMKKWFK